MDDNRITLVLGGARSGKSAYAEQLMQGCRPRIYIATAEAGDAEMAARIGHHRQRRGADWHTVEAPRALAGAIAAHGEDASHILVDCVTVWLSNLMLDGEDGDAAIGDLIAALRDCKARVVLVSNEVGMGIVPDNALARAFRDVAGRANQRLAAAADKVVLVAAGLPLTLKSA